ncbi:hypothetical protein ACFVWY_32350 [Streptomyces sp. NPDC058195]|uniref:hypothetical protein n=1 Tax=Streptomyces sp. NPDC058195 TaxID=3346375 RepID=UPI0036E964FB
MSVPEGAHAVTYRFTAYGDGVEIGTTLEFPLSSSPTQQPHEDAAAQSAAEAYRATIAAAYPAVPVHTSRTYQCRLPDSTWPTASA